MRRLLRRLKTLTPFVRLQRRVLRSGCRVSVDLPGLWSASAWTRSGGGVDHVALGFWISRDYYQVDVDVIVWGNGVHVSRIRRASRLGLRKRTWAPLDVWIPLWAYRPS